MKRIPLPTLSVLTLASLALSALILLPLAACGAGDGASALAGGDGQAANGAPQTRFRLTSLDGAEIGPPDFAGDVVLVDFWATWCVPCHAQAEVLKQLYADVGGDGVEFLAVDVGETESQVRGFVDRRPFPYPVLLDEQSELADSLGVTGLPTLMVIDRQGEVTYFNAGVLSQNEVCRALHDAGAELTC
jgi:thiol-disulfide isomerase/thioredoxin